MEVIVRSGAIERHQMEKEVSKPAALKQMTDIYNRERVKSTDPWWKRRVDWMEAAKNAKGVKICLMILSFNIPFPHMVKR